MAFLLLMFSLLSGTIGFHVIEDFNWLDAFYMSVITLSTVGFTEVHALSDSGRLFTAIYILLNLAILAYVVSVITSFIFEGKFHSIYKNYMSDLKINKLNNHIIVCGYGRNGKESCEELERSGKQYVVIEKDAELVENFSSNTDSYMLYGDAISDHSLKTAGIHRADIIIVSTPSDADNVFITLTSRELQPDINIISRASEKESVSKLYRAGANHVVMPDALGGMFMAQMVTKPIVAEFLNLMTSFHDQHFHLEQLHYEDMKPAYRDCSIEELDIHEKTGGTVIGVKNNVNGLIPSPKKDTHIGPKDTIVVLGGEQQLKLIRKEYLK